MWGGTFSRGERRLHANRPATTLRCDRGLSEESETTLEQSNLGWKTDDTFTGLEESTLSLQLGRFDYSIGTGMIINDGGSDGGDRGGWYSACARRFRTARWSASTARR